MVNTSSVRVPLSAFLVPPHPPVDSAPARRARPGPPHRWFRTLLNSVRAPPRPSHEPARSECQAQTTKSVWHPFKYKSRDRRSRGRRSAQSNPLPYNLSPTPLRSPLVWMTITTHDLSTIQHAHLLTRTKQHLAAPTAKAPTPPTHTPTSTQHAAIDRTSILTATRQHP